MKKLMYVALILSIPLMLIFCSCSPTIDNDKKTVDTRMEQVLGVIKKQDKSAMKKLFCKKALNDDKDIDKTISSLFVFFRGDVVSYKLYAGPVATEERNVDGPGSHKKELEATFDVVTQKQKYRIALQEFTIDTTHPDNTNGIYSLCIIKATNTDEHFAYWGEGKLGTPGIVIQYK